MVDKKDNSTMRGELAAIILQLGSSLGPDESNRTICPKCGGGQSGEKSFNITRVPSGLVYKCFRAKCGFEGLAGGILNPPSPLGVGRKRREPYKGNLVNIPGAVFARVFFKYGLEYKDVEDQGVKFASEIGRLYFPIYDYRGYVVGEILRAVSSSQKPKTLLNKFSDNVCLLYAPLGIDYKDRLVLVEDIISALKVNKVAPCMALLGTNCPDNCLSMLKQMGIKTIHLMLDGDDAGLAASLKLQHKLSPFFSTSNIILPQGHDPKDMTIGELEAFLL